MRTYRQRKVITALINKAKRTPLTKLIAIMRDIFPLITTDLSPLEITGLAYKGGMSMLLFDIEQTRVPLEDQCDAGMHNGQWTEVLDFDAVRRYLHDFYLYRQNRRFRQITFFCTKQKSAVNPNFAR